METYYFWRIFFSLIFTLFIHPDNSGEIQGNRQKSGLDTRVEQFLEKHKYRWHDMNIPTADGKILFDIITENNYKNAVEIGTSTGHSAIWIAWALSKTGGKLITIEINETRYRKALENFREAGLEDYIDARLEDAHKLVPRLKGPIDFVFCDADKGWYTNYFKDIEDKIVPGGCFTAHNITRGRRQPGITEFVNHIESQANYKTTYNNTGGGISISYKIK